MDQKRLQRALEQIGPGFLELARALEHDAPEPRERTGLLDVATAAACVGLTPRTLRQAIKAGTLPASRLGREYRVDPGALREWVDASRVTPREEPPPKADPRQTAFPWPEAPPAEPPESAQEAPEGESPPSPAEQGRAALEAVLARKPAKGRLTLVRGRKRA